MIRLVCAVRKCSPDVQTQDAVVGIWEVIVTITTLVLSILLSTGSFAWGYADKGFASLSHWMLTFGLLWLFSQWRGWKWFPPFALFLSILAAMIGLWLNFSIGWMFSGAIFALLAWDMTELRKKLYLLPPREDAAGFVQRHILRVSLLALGGFLFATALMYWRGQLSPAWGVFLFCMILLGLAGQLAVRVKK